MKKQKIKELVYNLQLWLIMRGYNKKAKELIKKINELI